MDWGISLSVAVGGVIFYAFVIITIIAIFLILAAIAKVFDYYS